MTISWIYRYWCDILEFFILRLMTRYSGIGHCWRWLAFEHFTIFCRYWAFPHSSVLHDMMISITFLQLTMWRYSALFDYSAFDDIAQLMLLWRYPVIQHFYVCLTISRIFRFISFPLIYLDCVHFRPFMIIRLMSFRRYPRFELIPLRHH